jgi:hypothetical protein
VFQLRNAARACLLLTSFLVLAISCGSSVDPLGPRLDLSLMIMTPSAASSTLYASLGDRTVSLSVPDGSVGRVDKRVRGTGYGEIPVRLTLMGGGDTLASASFTQKLQANYNYGIGVIVGPERQPAFCTVTIMAVPLRNSTTDSLFVDVAGLPQGAVC